MSTTPKVWSTDLFDYDEKTKTFRSSFKRIFGQNYGNKGCMFIDLQTDVNREILCLESSVTGTVVEFQWDKFLTDDEVKYIYNDSSNPALDGMTVLIECAFDK